MEQKLRKKRLRTISLSDSDESVDCPEKSMTLSSLQKWKFAPKTSLFELFVPEFLGHIYIVLEVIV